VFALVRVSSPRPILQVAVDLAVQCCEGAFRGNVAVKVGPAPDVSTVIEKYPFSVIEKYPPPL